MLQGGAFTFDEELGPVDIPKFAAINSEEGPFPEYSNVKGTIAMALSGSGNDTATSSWFINLDDNDGSGLNNLDTLNGGFTVFGSILSGLDVLQAYVGFTNFAGGSAANVIVDLTGGSLTSPFGDVPITKIVNNTYDTADLIYTTWTVVPEPSTATLLGLAGLGLIYVNRFPRRSRTPFPGGSAPR